MAIVLFNTALCRSAFSTFFCIFSFLGKLVFYAFCVFYFESNVLNQDIKIYVLSCYIILLCNFVLTLYKNSPLINNTKALFIKILLCKDMLSEKF